MVLPYYLWVSLGACIVFFSMNLYWWLRMKGLFQKRVENHHALIQLTEKTQEKRKEFLEEYKKSIAVARAELQNKNMQSQRNAERDFEEEMFLEHLKHKIFTNDLIVVGKGARIHADVEAESAIIQGEVNGAIRAKRKVEIHKTGILRGAVTTPILNVSEGAIFEGKTLMGEPQSPDAF